MLHFPFLLILLFSASFLFGAERYKDCFFETVVTKDIVYQDGIPSLSSMHMISALMSGLNFYSHTGLTFSFYKNSVDFHYQSLTFDLYEPANDTCKNRPLVILIHGGGFIAGEKDDKSQISIRYCDSLAARGYVVASIKYRKGLVLRNHRNELHIDEDDFKRAILWASEDLSAAILFFKKNAERFAIDPRKIFVIGNSSGAIVALNNAFGNFDEKATAVVSLWGAVVDTSFHFSNKIPILLVHGKNDKVIPFDMGRLDLESLIHENRDFYPAYKQFSTAYIFKFHSPVFLGGYAIHEKMKKHNITHKTLFFENGEHELYNKKDYEEQVRNAIFIFLYKCIKK